VDDPKGAADAWKRAVELYDAGRRHKTDERYREIQQKLRLLTP